MCYICAPYQNSFYGQEKLTVCEEFCNAWYAACSSAILKGSVIGGLYTNGREFCEKRNFQCEPMKNKNCFIFDYALHQVSNEAGVARSYQNYFAIVCYIYMSIWIFLISTTIEFDTPLLLI